ncbi:MAG: MarR family transcriptional regulator [Levilactobacillus sp.]|jgi:MarR family transcriptional regulator for hemolysin|uniref:MarR family transcriptional regulator n=1 Tax=Levilactobacillus suantsaiihabitans TaxID=2487722 RepID=A0A4Z0JE24_9LACO|nr:MULTISPECIES: MarR family transcriptional regulator [Levilactobacillus]MCI1552937.1 MarR family transcriptional regulator [Levilactobacillus sp.]MCI1598077.1 MarR family transcriptional regulator [Levilactobacillus sp.]MCI1606089.1 MarR family transcriptional regulator [Levilactobacillus sp.]TGD19998.1 MarR family transcriptional regulator [Levilactobacillus suantsaiihabitans]
MEDSILDFTTNLAILHRQFQRAMNQILEADEMPINITEFYLLVLVSETSQLNQRKAAWTMAVDEGLMARMVHHLVDLKLLQKETDPDDRRNRRLTLTTDGQALVKQAITVLHDWWQQVTPTDADFDYAGITAQLQLLSSRVLRDQTESH